MEGSTVFQSLNNVIYKCICLISTGNSKTLQTEVGNCSKAELLFIILYVHLPWFPLTNFYQEWGQHTYHYSFRIMDKIKSIFLSHLKVVFVQTGTQAVHTHLESSKTVQIFVYSSILLTGFEFNCTVRDFPCPRHWLLIDVNVILELHTKVSTDICKIFVSFCSTRMILQRLLCTVLIWGESYSKIIVLLSLQSARFVDTNQ